MSNHPSRGASPDATPTAALPLVVDHGETALDTQRPKRWSIPGLLGLLGHARATWLIVAFAMFLTSSALTMGLTGDDHLHTLMLRSETGIEGLATRTLDLFSFATDDAVRTHGMKQEGLFPWWTDPQVVIAFFRPLSSATHWLDRRLWPERPALMHLHSMLWLAALLFAAAQVYQRFFGTRWMAGLALLLYAVDDARAAPVGWIANRNAMIAAIPPLLGLLAHDRARRDGDRRALWLAALLYALGLCAGEAAVQMLGYFVAYTVCLDSGTRKQRVASVAPYFAITVVWRVVYVALGYGAHRSGLYLDPAAHPLSFLAEFVTRLPVLLLAEFALPWSEFWDLAPVLSPLVQPGMLLLAGIVITLLITLMTPLWKRDATVRFWGLGCLLATIPACAAVPNDRLLTATGIGGAAIIAHFLGALAEGSYPWRGRPVRIAAELVIFIHLLFAPFALPGRTKAIDGLELLVTRADLSIPRTPDIAQREVVVINPPVDPVAVYFAVYRQVHDIPRPKYFRWLATGICDIAITRLDDHTLRMRPKDGFLSNSSQWMLRDPKIPTQLGERVELDDATFTITDITLDARPAQVDIRFVERLDSDRLQWMQWGTHDYVPFHLPKNGESVVVPAVDMKKALFGIGMWDN